MPKLDEAYKTQMTPEEIVAFEADDEDAAEEAIAALAERGGVLEDDDDEPEDDPDLEGDDLDKGEEDPAPAPEPAKEDPAPAPEPPVDVEAARLKVEQGKAMRKELHDQYNDGDISDEEYEAKLDELTESIADAQADLKIAEKQAQAAATGWQSAGEAYIARYPGLNEPSVLEAFNMAINDLSRLSSMQNLSHEEFLLRAHRKLMADATFLGIDVPALDAEPSKKKSAPSTPTPPKGDPSLGKTPKTLGGVPASDVAHPNTNRFAYLDDLAERSPAAFEAEFMKLTKAEQDAYMRQDEG